MKFQKPGVLQVVRQYLTKREIIHNPGATGTKMVQFRLINKED